MMARMKIMLVALVGVATAMPVLAQERAQRPSSLNPAPAFRDLPGVVPQEERVRQKNAESLDCTTATEYRRWRRGDPFPDFPVEVYRCEKNGIVYSGTAMPDRPWVPGLNPADLPKK